MNGTRQYSKWWAKAKGIVAALVPVAAVVQTAITDDRIEGTEWQTIAIAVVGAVGVYFVPNKGYVNEDVPALH